MIECDPQPFIEIFFFRHFQAILESLDETYQDFPTKVVLERFVEDIVVFYVGSFFDSTDHNPPTLDGSLIQKYGREIFEPTSNDLADDISIRIEEDSEWYSRIFETVIGRYNINAPSDLPFDAEKVGRLAARYFLSDIVKLGLKREDLLYLED